MKQIPFMSMISWSPRPMPILEILLNVSRLILPLPDTYLKFWSCKAAYAESSIRVLLCYGLLGKTCSCQKFKDLRKLNLAFDLVKYSKQNTRFVALIVRTRNCDNIFENLNSSKGLFQFSISSTHYEYDVT